MKYIIYLLSSILLILEILWVIDNTFTHDFHIKVDVEYTRTDDKSEDSCIISTTSFISAASNRNKALKKSKLRYILFGNKALCTDIWKTEEFPTIFVGYSKLFNFSRYVEIIRQSKSTNVYYTPYVLDHIFYLINGAITLLLLFSYLDFNSYISKYKYSFIIPLYIYLFNN